VSAWGEGRKAVGGGTELKAPQAGRQTGRQVPLSDGTWLQVLSPLVSGTSEARSQPMQHQ